jgi:hypothetical protein
MKKAVSVLFSIMLVGFLVMTSGAIAEEAPESSSNEEAIFGSASEGSAALDGSEDSETITRLLIEGAETPEEQESTPSDLVLN